MTRKRLLLLADSGKDGGRCVAGREVLAGAAGFGWGAWVRPVTAHGRGELFDADRRPPGGLSHRLRRVLPLAVDDEAAGGLTTGSGRRLSELFGAHALATSRNGYRVPVRELSNVTARTQ